MWGGGFKWVEASRCLLEEGAPKSALEGGRPVGEGLLGLAGKLLTLQGAGPGGRRACPEGPVVTVMPSPLCAYVWGLAHGGCQ